MQNCYDTVDYITYVIHYISWLTYLMSGTLSLLIYFTDFIYFPLPFPLATTILFSESLGLFFEFILLHLFCFYIPHIMWDDTVFFYVWFSSLSINSLYIHPWCCKWQDLLFDGWVIFIFLIYMNVCTIYIIHTHTHTISSLLIHLSMDIYVAIVNNVIMNIGVHMSFN